MVYDSVDALPEKYQDQARTKLLNQELQGQMRIELQNGAIQIQEVETESSQLLEQKRKLRLIIPGKPQPKQRAIVNTYTKKAHTPDATVRYEHEVGRLWRVKHGNTMLQGPLKITVLMCFAVPKSDSKIKQQKKLNDEIKHTIKPDVLLMC